MVVVVVVVRIATGESEDNPSKSPKRAKASKIGGKRRSEALSP